MGMFDNLYCTINMFVYEYFYPENLDLYWIEMKHWCQISERTKNIMSYPSPITSIGPIEVIGVMLFFDGFYFAIISQTMPVHDLYCGPYCILESVL